MKKLLSMVLSVIMILSCFSCVAFADDEIKITLNGTNLKMDQPPVIINGRTLVPLRAIFEGLGATVSWDDATRCATGVKDGKEIKITIDSATAYVDGNAVTLDVPAQILSNRTMVPVRFISESLGEKVDWNGETRTVIITSEKPVSKKIIFDDLTSFENNKDYALGGGYKAEGVSLSTDVDHTFGNGKSLKMDKRTATSSRVKLNYMFTSNDIGKTFNISAYFYAPDKAILRLGTYGLSGTEHAMLPAAVAQANVQAGEWTKIELTYKHEDTTVTQIGFDQGASKTIPLFYVDDIEISTQGAVTPDENNGELKLRKAYKFDDLSSFDAYILGGGYKAENVSLSTDVDHTVGNGKSLKLANRTSTSHRLKLKDVFTSSDIGKTFTIKAWIYIPDATSIIEMGAYSTTNTQYAMKPIVSEKVNVGKNEWTLIELVYKHENELITQIGFDQGASKTIPTFYIDDVEIFEGGTLEVPPSSSTVEKEEVIDVNFVTDGHRPVPTNFTKGKSYDELIYYGVNKKTPEELLAALPQGKEVVGGNYIVDAISGAEQDRYDPSHGKLEAIDITNMPFTKAVRATVYNPLNPPYTFQLSLGTPLAGKAEEGDVCLLKLWMRTESGGAGEAQMGSVMVVIEENGGAHAKTIAANVTNASEWKEFYFPFVFKDNFTSAKIRLAYYSQVVDLAGYTITNFGKDVKIEDLPTDSSSAPYLMPDAQWRKDAWDRIEKIRKGDFKVIVKDASGNVIPNADVSVNMYDHEFEWGVAVNTPVLSDANYQNKLSENFNAAVLENHNKWVYYEKDPKLTKDILKRIQDLGINKIRGHVLLWDIAWYEGCSSVPADVPLLHGDKEALQKRIKEHIVGTTSNLKSYIPYEWDVLNEAVRHHVIRDIYGVEIVKEWFDMAREAMGEEGRLYYNDFDRTDAEFKLLQEYVDAGVDFDGIGIQSHYGSPENPETIYEHFEKIAKFGKRIKVTEYDFSSTDFELQANFTRDFMITAFSHASVDGFIMWGFRGADKYVLYDKEYNPKPGLAVWQDLIYNKWWTDESGKTGSDGAFNVRGFYGDYDITASANGKTKTVTAKLYKNSNNVVEIVID